MSGSTRTFRSTPRWANVVLWVAAVACMLGAVVYQRLTGPTHPLRGSFMVGGSEYRYSLIRSQDTTTPARVSIPDPGGGVTATLHYKRYPTDDPFTAISMVSEGGGLSADLPVQPAAGKVEYFVTVRTPTGVQHVPDGADTTIVLRYKNPVPLGALLPHVVLMFFAVLFGIRAGLSAVFGPDRMRRHAWATLVGMTLGGMVLGPIVQKYAFGAFWTGWPFGSDLTDNKVLLMWVVWIVACSTIGFRPIRKEWVGRVLVALAAAVMTSVYLIPHSMRGSELSYQAVDSGIDPAAAIGTSAE